MPPMIGMAVDALHLLGGQIDWAGLPMVMEMLGVEDIEGMVRLMRIVLTNERA